MNNRYPNWDRCYAAQTSFVQSSIKARCTTSKCQCDIFGAAGAVTWNSYRTAINHTGGVETHQIGADQGALGNCGRAVCGYSTTDFHGEQVIAVRRDINRAWTKGHNIITIAIFNTRCGCCSIGDLICLTFDLTQCNTATWQNQVDNVVRNCRARWGNRCTVEGQRESLVQIGANRYQVFSHENKDVGDVTAGVHNCDSFVKGWSNSGDRRSSIWGDCVFAREVCRCVLEAVTTRVTSGNTDSGQSSQDIIVNIRKGCGVVRRVIRNAAGGEGRSRPGSSCRSSAAVIDIVQNIQSERAVLGFDKADSRVSRQAFGEVHNQRTFWVIGQASATCDFQYDWTRAVGNCSGCCDIRQGLQSACGRVINARIGRSCRGQREVVWDRCRAGRSGVCIGGASLAGFQETGVTCGAIQGRLRSSDVNDRGIGRVCRNSYSRGGCWCNAIKDREASRVQGTDVFNEINLNTVDDTVNTGRCAVQSIQGCDRWGRSQGIVQINRGVCSGQSATVSGRNWTCTNSQSQC